MKDTGIIKGEPTKENGLIPVELGDGTLIYAHWIPNSEPVVGQAVDIERTAAGSMLATAKNSYNFNQLFQKSGLQKYAQRASWDVDFANGKIWNEPFGKPKKKTTTAISYLMKAKDNSIVDGFVVTNHQGFTEVETVPAYISKSYRTINLNADGWAIPFLGFSPTLSTPSVGFYAEKKEETIAPSFYGGRLYQSNYVSLIDTSITNSTVFSIDSKISLNHPTPTNQVRDFLIPSGLISPTELGFADIAPARLVTYNITITSLFEGHSWWVVDDDPSTEVIEGYEVDSIVTVHNLSYSPYWRSDGTILIDTQGTSYINQKVEGEGGTKGTDGGISYLCSGDNCTPYESYSEGLAVTSKESISWHLNGGTVINSKPGLARINIEPMPPEGLRISLGWPYSIPNYESHKIVKDSEKDGDGSIYLGNVFYVEIVDNEYRKYETNCNIVTEQGALFLDIHLTTDYVVVDFDLLAAVSSTGRALYTENGSLWDIFIDNSLSYINDYGNFNYGVNIYPFNFFSSPNMTNNVTKDPHYQINSTPLIITWCGKYFVRTLKKRDFNVEESEIEIFGDLFKIEESDGLVNFIKQDTFFRTTLDSAIIKEAFSVDDFEVLYASIRLGEEYE